MRVSIPSASVLVALAVAPAAPVHAAAQQGATLTVTVTDLPAGAATVTVERVGYSRASVSTTLAAGRQSRLEVALVAVARCPRAAACYGREFAPGEIEGIERCTPAPVFPRSSTGAAPSAA